MAIGGVNVCGRLGIAKRSMWLSAGGGAQRDTDAPGFETKYLSTNGQSFYCARFPTTPIKYLQWSVPLLENAEGGQLTARFFFFNDGTSGGSPSLYIQGRMYQSAEDADQVWGTAANTGIGIVSPTANILYISDAVVFTPNGTQGVPGLLQLRAYRSGGTCTNDILIFGVLLSYKVVEYSDRD